MALIVSANKAHSSFSNFWGSVVGSFGDQPGPPSRNPEPPSRNSTHGGNTLGAPFSLGSPSRNSTHGGNATGAPVGRSPPMVPPDLTRADQVASVLEPQASRPRMVNVKDRKASK